MCWLCGAAGVNVIYTSNTSEGIAIFSIYKLSHMVIYSYNTANCLIFPSF